MPKDALLETADVVALYSSMPDEVGLKALKETLV